MDETFKNLTQKQIHATPVDAGFIAVGVVRQLDPYTIIYLHADKTDNGYQPSISLFTHGKQIKPMDDPYCFNLIKQTGMVVCVRGIRFYSNGRPASFLVEVYRPLRVALRVVK